MTHTGRFRAIVCGVAVAALVAACSPAPPPTAVATPSGSVPSSSPAGPPRSSAPATAGDLALEACDLTGYIPCEHQAVLLREPVTATGVALTYSSEWAPGRTDRKGWDATPIGLGGWSLDVLQRYDPVAGVLLAGDGSWRLAKGITLPSGERAVPSYDGRLAYVFDAKNRHVRTVDALLGTTLVTFSYDAEGRLAGADGSLDGTLIHLIAEREADGALSGLTGVGGARTAAFLDSAGHLGGTRDAAGHETVFTSGADGLVSAVYDPTGGVTTYAYDDAGQLASMTDPDGVVVTRARTATADAVEIKATSALGRASVYRSERSGTGLVHDFMAPDGTHTTATTDATGQYAIALADGTTIALGAQPDPRWGMDAPVPSPVDVTRPGGAISHATASVAVTATAGDPLAVSAWSRTDAVAGGTWVERADPAARTLAWSDPAGRTTVQAYDAAGRLVSQVEPGQPNLAFAYDDLGRIATSTAGSGADAATTTYAYGNDGMVTITRPDAAVERLAFDAVGRIVKWASPDGGTVLSDYDALGRLVRVAPAGQPSSAIGRSAAGRQTGFLPPVIGADGTYETRTYDTDGNLATVAGPGDRAISYTYDAQGRVTGWSFDQGTGQAAYDATSGLLTGTSSPGVVGTQLAYAGGIAVGRTVTGPVAGAVTDTLDPQGRIAGESVDGSTPITYTYDTAGLLTSVGDVSLRRDAATGAVSGASIGAVETTREYDTHGRPNRIAVMAGGVPVLEVRYGYDIRGRVASMIETRSGGTPVHTTYAYDTSGRLAAVTVDGATVERDGYDAAGNRVSVKTPAGTLAATYDDRDRLVRWGQASYTFQPDGQLAGVQAGTAATSYVFDDFGDLRSVALPDGRKVTYLVDADGNRVGKQVDGTFVAGYLYRPDGRLVAEIDASGAVVARFGYDDAGRLSLVERGTAHYQVVTDHLGSPLLVIDAASGAVADAIAYDAWGAVTSESAPGFLPIGFAGGLRDADTGLVKFGAREYEPRTGRWTGPDPIRYAGGDAVLYRYVAGDPVNAIDPTGLAPQHHPWSDYGSDGWDPMSNFPPDPNQHPSELPNSNSLPGGESPSQGADPNASPPWGPPIGTTPPHDGYFTGTPSEPKMPDLFPPINACGDLGACGPGQSQDDWCLGYCGSGEPHERTGDGVTFGFQGAGEYQMVASPDGSVVVQGRMEPYGTSTLVTLGTAIAASVGGDRVAVYASDTTPLTINGKAQTRADLSMRLPHEGSVEHHGATTTIAWPGGSRLDVVQAGSHLDFSLVPDPATAPTLRGLLGSADGNPANDLTTRDGTVLDPNDPAFATKLYDPFGASWRITQAESLFDYAPGESTATFAKPDFPHGPATIDALDPTARSKAEAVCRAMGISGEPTLADCILDVGITGDTSYVASAAAIQVATATAGAELPGGGAAPFSTLLRRVIGAISKAGQVDRATFDAKAGDVVYLDAQGACATGVLWRLVGPSGPGAMSLGHSCDDLGRFVLADPGTYAVEVYTDTDGATGAYAYDIVGAPVERTYPLTLGKVVSDATTRIGEWHRYTFDAKAGDVVVLDGRGPYVPGLLWSLVGPSGSRLGLGTASEDLGRIVLPDAGTYAVEVYADGTATGPYAFQVSPGG
jgi:RHS repeat-associated protein